MKYHIITIIILIFPCIGMAKCGHAVEVFPKGTRINLDGHILIQASGYGKAHTILEALDEYYPIYLNSINGKIRLKKKEFIRGQKNWSQILLLPEKKLNEGVSYNLVIEKLTKEEKTYINPNRLIHNKQSGQVYWTAHKHDDIGVLSPDWVDSKVISYGCGPSVESTFRLFAKPVNDKIIKVEILNEYDGQLDKYYLNTSFGRVKIGHGMCSGPYKFKKGKSYQIRFSREYLIDKDENSKWIECANPWERYNDN